MDIFALGKSLSLSAAKEGLLQLLARGVLSSLALALKQQRHQQQQQHRAKLTATITDWVSCLQYVIIFVSDMVKRDKLPACAIFSGTGIYCSLPKKQQQQQKTKKQQQQQTNKKQTNSKERER